MPRKSRRRRIRKSKGFIKVRRPRRGTRRHHNGGGFIDEATEQATAKFTQFQQQGQTQARNLYNRAQEVVSGWFSRATKP